MVKRNFFNRVYEVAKKIPVGQVMTYGEIAELIGTRDARRVGHALHANKNPNIPCHRVVNKEGRLAPGYAFGGPNEQKNRLISEGIKFSDDDRINLSKYSAKTIF